MRNGGSLKDLSARRIAILAADGFEKVELTVPLRALQVAGAQVDVVSLRHGRIRGVNLHEPAGRVAVTKTVREASASDYDGLLIPGGFINPDMLRQSAAVRTFVREFDAAGKPIASLCHGPWVLASAGVLRGRTITAWPGIRDDIVNAGAIWLDRPVVRDRNLVTSRGPQDLMQFVPALEALFSGEAAEPAPAAAASDPPADDPPPVVLETMRWMPRPSLRTAVGMSILALGYRAIRSRAA
jgi:protease I